MHLKYKDSHDQSWQIKALIIFNYHTLGTQIMQVLCVLALTWQLAEISNITRYYLFCLYVYPNCYISWLWACEIPAFCTDCSGEIANPKPQGHLTLKCMWTSSNEQTEIRVFTDTSHLPAALKTNHRFIASRTQHKYGCIPGPVATLFPQVVVATLPGIMSQYRTLPGAGSVIVDGGAILPLPEKLLSNPAHSLAIKHRRNVESMLAPTAGARADFRP